MPAFDRVVMIFNPHSTGQALQRAEKLRDNLGSHLPALPVELLPTEHAGHAVDLAREAAAAGSPLIVSVSGDGGYNEVINGAMSAHADRWVCAVLPAGNANDHRRATKERPLAQAIVEGTVTRIDLLRMTVNDSPQSRYAHSYIGLGLTPVVAVELEKGGKGSLREMVTTIRAFARFQPFEIQLADGARTHFDSLVFANIHQMAKVATLSKDTGRPDDGQFEVITVAHQAKWRVLGTALKAGLRGLGEQPSVRAYRFTTVKPIPIQVDGEVTDLDSGDTVQVDAAPQALRTLL